MTDAERITKLETQLEERIKFSDERRKFDDERWDNQEAWNKDIKIAQNILDDHIKVQLPKQKKDLIKEIKVWIKWIAFIATTVGVLSGWAIKIIADNLAKAL